MSKEQKQAKKSAKSRARRRSYIKQKHIKKVSEAKIAKDRKNKAIEFNRIYAEKGGLPKLLRMRRNLSTQDEMAEHFGVVKETIRYWMAALFDDSYDPREERRERKIEKYIKYIKKHGTERFEKFCSDSKVNDLYKEAALTRFKEQS